ncbi:integrase [Mesorhizobium sp. B2-4-4]|nr:integrase [Mesorhizobium sp. B2-4-4]
MAGKVRNLLNRDGRYFARLVIPKEIRPFMDGKTELRTALGPDYRTALRLLPGAVADLQHKIALGERRAIEAGTKPVTVGRYPLAADQIALRNYQARLAFDDAARNDWRYASVGVDDLFAAKLREGMAGRLNDAELVELVGARIERYRHLGNTTAEMGSDEWRTVARAMCISEYEALSRVAERDEGDFTGQPSHPMLAQAKIEEPLPPATRVTFGSIIDAEVKRRERGKDAKPFPAKTVKKYRDHADAFASWRNSTDAATVTADEGKRWVEAMQDAGANGNRTVKQKLQNVRTVLNWGRQADPLNFLPAGNPLIGLKSPDYTKTPSYLHAFTIEEAKLILSKTRQETKPFLRWIPWLCAYSGMRISEVAKLRKEDFFKAGDRWFWKVTTAGGRTLKNESSERRIPVHKALIDEGLMIFVDKAPSGLLFRGETKDDIDLQPRVSEWVRGFITGEDRPDLKPNHGWRHLFEDLCRRDRVQEEARYYITGRSDGRSQEMYGRSDVMLPGLADAMDQIAPLQIDQTN